MFSRFFIERPILANVIAYVTVLIGAVTLFLLPVEQYPQITPPTVQVSTNYPGADAQVLSDTVAAPIEQQVNGVEGMLYMSSTCASDGSYNLTVTFEVGTNTDMAQVLVQNRVAIALPKLPEEVQRQGVVTKKKSTAIIMVVAITSPDGRFDSLYLSNYATLRVKDVLSRIKGVGDINIVGSSEYGMRIWIDPERLKARELTTEDVVRSIREQNVQVAAGQIGEPPGPATQDFQLTITTLGRLQTPEQFADIIVKAGRGEDANLSARITRVRDVARVELGGQTYSQWCDVTGKPAAGVVVYQLPGANALDVARNVFTAMDELKKSFPEGVEYSVPYNTTIFVEESIREVYKTLIEAGVLVLVVIMLFLQDWRAVLVPATTVPVTIIGAFAAMAAAGLLDQLADPLRAGAGGRHRGRRRHRDRRKRLPPHRPRRPASQGSDHQGHVGSDRPRHGHHARADGGIPAHGVPGRDHRPALPPVRPDHRRHRGHQRDQRGHAQAGSVRDLPAAKPRAPERVLPRLQRGLRPGRTGLHANRQPAGAARVAAMMALFAALVGLTGWWFTRLPTGFLPIEDQGYAIVGIQLPDAASQARTREVVNRVESILKETDGIGNWVMIGGLSVLDQANASNAALLYVRWTPYEERTRPELSQDALLGKLRGRFQEIKEAIVFVFPPPAIQGLGVAGGFQLQLEDRGGVGLTELQQLTDEMIEAGNAQTSLKALNTTFRSGVPQLYADIDRIKAKSVEVPLDVVFGTLQAALGSSYVNDFNLFGRTYQVRVQADQKFRQQPEDIRRLEVRDLQGKMIPLGTMVEVKPRLGPQILTRYNLYPSSSITGEAAAGFSSGQALKIMEQMADAEAAQVDGIRMDGDVVPGEESRIAGHLCVRASPCSWFTWCWRASTRAVSCRSP